MSRAGTVRLAVPLLVALVAGGALASASPRSAARSRAAEPCGGTSLADFACQRRRYEALVRDQGARAALEQLQADADRNEVVRATCHALAHAIAHAPARRGAQARPVGDLGALCGSGYDAGRIEVFVAGAASERTLHHPDVVCADVID